MAKLLDIKDLPQTKLMFSIEDDNTSLVEYGRDIQSKWIEVIRDFEEGIYRKPKHQRPNVWSKRKKTMFINRIRSSLPAISAISIYALESSRSVYYINDGMQRLRACQEFLKYPDQYGLTEKDAKKILRKSVTIQERIYKSHHLACLDFQHHNQGTPMSPKDFYHGILVHIPDTEHLFSQIDILNNNLQENAARILSAKAINTAKNKIKKDQWIRHSYSMLYRFLETNSNLKLKDIVITDVTIGTNQMLKPNVIENLLVNVLYDISDYEHSIYKGYKKEILEKSVKQLCKFINDQTALFNFCWQKQKNDNSTGIHSMTLYRWLLDMGMYVRFKKIQKEKWSNFIIEIFKHSMKKTSQLLFENYGSYEPITVSAGRLSVVNRIIKFLDIDFSPTKHTGITSNKKAGFDDSHILPLSKYGEGKTFIEPSILNKARGAKPVYNIQDHLF